MANKMSEEEAETILALCTTDASYSKDWDAVKFAEVTRTLASLLLTHSGQDARLMTAMRFLKSIWQRRLCSGEAFLQSGAVQGYCRVLLAAEETIRTNPFETEHAMVKKTQEHSLRSLIDISTEHIVETLELGVLNAVLATIHTVSQDNKNLVMTLVHKMCLQVRNHYNPIGISKEAFTVLLSLMHEDQLACQCVMLLARAYVRYEEGKELLMKSEQFVIGLVRLLSVLPNTVESIMQDLLYILSKCTRDSTAFKLKFCQPEISVSLSRSVLGLFRASMARPLSISLKIIRCLVGRAEDVQGMNGDSGMYLKFAAEMTQLIIDVYFLSKVSAEKTLCLEILEEILKSMTKIENVAGLFRETNILCFFLTDLMFSNNSDPHIHVIQEIVSIMSLLMKKFPAQFPRRFAREGGVFALNQVICNFKGSSKRLLIRSIMKKASDIIKHCETLADPKSELKEELLDKESFSEVQTSMEMIYRISKKQREEDCFDDGMTTREILLSGILQYLLDYFDNNENLRKKQQKMSKITPKLKAREKQVYALMRCCLSTTEKPIFHRLWSAFVRKIRQSLDVALHVGSIEADELLLLLSIAERANRFIPTIIHRQLAEESACGWTRLLDIQAESALQCQSALAAAEFVSRPLSLRIEEYDKEQRLTILMYANPQLFSWEAKIWFLYHPLPVDHPPPDHVQDSDSETELDDLNAIFHRQNLLPTAEDFFEEVSTEPLKSVHVMFEGERGEGLGPTREFFTLLSQELHQFQAMWRSSSSDALFPRPYHPDCVKDEILDKFRLLGRFMGKAFREGFTLDIPLSRAFYKMATLEEDLDIDDILEFDQKLGWVLLELESIGNLNHYTYRGCSTYRGCNIRDLGLTFRLPGYEEYILSNHSNFTKDGDVLVDCWNLRDYVKKVLEATVVEGVRAQVEEFRTGFNEVSDMSLINIFSAKQLQTLFCGDEDKGQVWSREMLQECIKFEFEGVTEDRKKNIFKENVIGILSEFSEKERKLCLVFMTGNARLPVVGLKAGYITVTAVPDYEDNGDGRLPTAATCSRNVRVPYYNNLKHVMRAKLSYAITHGSSHFEFI